MPLIPSIRYSVISSELFNIGLPHNSARFGSQGLHINPDFTIISIESTLHSSGCQLIHYHLYISITPSLIHWNHRKRKFTMPLPAWTARSHTNACDFLLNETKFNTLDPPSTHPSPTLSQLTKGSKARDVMKYHSSQSMPLHTKTMSIEVFFDGLTHHV